MSYDAHDIVMTEFERHLAGNASKAFYDHLAACPPCKTEVAAMTEVASLLPALAMASEESFEPRAGFYARVAGTINDQHSRQGWGLFSMGEVFFRRLAFASLMLLAVLGSYLVTRDSDYQAEDAATIFAKHDPSAVHAAGEDRDHMLLTLASYQ